MPAMRARPRAGTHPLDEKPRSGWTKRHTLRSGSTRVDDVSVTAGTGGRESVWVGAVALRRADNPGMANWELHSADAYGAVVLVNFAAMPTGPPKSLRQ
jgi:hypothetical protein